MHVSVYKSVLQKLLTVCPQCFNYVRSTTTLLTILFREGEINKILTLCFFFLSVVRIYEVKVFLIHSSLFLPVHSHQCAGLNSRGGVHWQVMEFPPVRGEFIIKTRSINMKTSIWVWDRSTI